MELVLPTAPAAGYKPGDDVTGLLKYDITSQEETIRDVRLDFDGRAVTTPFKLKFEAQRSIVTLVGQSRTLFHGPSTLKRQLLAWPFTFTIPTSTTVEGSEVPLPPSMDHRFREGVLVNVRYSITATVWSGSDPDCGGRQQTRVLTVRPSIDLTTLRRRRYTLSFPTITFQTHPEPEAPWSRLWGVFSCSEEVDFSAPRQQALHLELTLPSTLLFDTQESVTCRLRGSSASENVFPSDPKFVIETLEFVLRSSLKWQNALQFQRHIGTTTRRPSTEIHADGPSVSLAESFGLRDLVHHHHDRETAVPLLQSYDSVVPEVSLRFRLTATVVLKHEASGRILVSSASVPVIVHGATAADSLFPPAYSCHEVLEEMGPPPYA
ncbi:hypothetical protein Q7P36_000516 [Cladosporium allicinum]